jgi:arabinogalactan oligomer/maltooligosaccharide transport system permease protein
VSGRSHRLAFGAGVLLAAGLGCWLSWRFVDQAARAETSAVEQRRAIVAVQGLAAIAAAAGDDGEALRRVVASWQAQSPGAAHARVVFMSGARLEASTDPQDAGDKAAPRRLAREEKVVYDRGQRLAGAVRENREQGVARVAEIEIAPAPGGRRLVLAAPVEVDGEPIGMVEMTTVELPPERREPVWPYLVALLAAVAVYAGGALLLRRRHSLAALAVVCVAGALGALIAVGSARVREARRGVAQEIGETARRQAALLAQLSGAPAVAPASLDVDLFRRPRGLLADDGAVDPDRLAALGREHDAALRKSLLAAAALALGVLLFAGYAARAVGRALWRDRRAYAYIAPAVIGVLVLVFFPFFYAILLSFTDSNLYNRNQPISELWVGLENYISILGDVDIVKQGEGGTVINYLNFYWTLGFTIVWTVTNVTIGVTSGLILALILNTRALAARPLYRALLILPWAMPNYITALIWRGMFHRQFGVINQALQIVGLPAVSWFESPFTSYLTALATNGWLSFPFMMVVSLGALQSIPADLYEAARVDGATRWQAFKAITLPSLRPALVPAVIISVVWTFNMFNIIYLVTGGEPGGATEILVTQSYKFAFERYQYGYAAAYSTVIFVILLIYGVIQNRVSKATEA